MSEQRFPYQGDPLRPLVKLTFADANGVNRTLSLIADTGCPFEVILSEDWFDQLVHTHTDEIESNFGFMSTGWIQLYMPEMGLVELINGCGSKEVGEIVSDDHQAFVGLVGLPILRLGEFGGNATEFWFRYPGT